MAAQPDEENPAPVKRGGITFSLQRLDGLSHTMKIVHVGRNVIDGYQYQENLLPKIQASMGHEVTMITSLGLSLPYYEMQQCDYEKTRPYWYEGVKIIRLEWSNGFLGYRFAKLKRLYDVIVSENPDLVFCHRIQGLDVLEVCKFKRNSPDCCVVADSHSDAHNSARNLCSRLLLHKGVWKRVARQAERYFDRIYYVSPCCRSFMKEVYGLGDGKLAPTYLGADMSFISSFDRRRIRSEIRQVLEIDEERFVIVTAGKFDKAKMTHLLFEAVEMLGDKSVHVIAVGSVDRDYRRTFFRHVDRNSNIHFTGWVPGGKVIEYFLAADAAVFPRSQSVLWQQAICCGLPCIFGYYPGGDYLNPGNNVKFLRSKDARELMDLIQQLIDDPIEFARMSRGALTLGVERFDYRNIADEIVRFAEEYRAASS